MHLSFFKDDFRKFVDTTDWLIGQCRVRMSGREICGGRLISLE